jgi:hypothetical protein
MIVVLFVVAACRGDSRQQKVTVATKSELIQELSTQGDFKTHTWRIFEPRPGVRIPVEGMWRRYEPFLGIPASVLVETGPSRPDSIRPNGKIVYYQQMHLGYPVAGYGYSVESVDGFLRFGRGQAVPISALPATLPTPISRERALTMALEHVTPKGVFPWLTKPADFAPPKQALVLWSRSIDPVGSAFRLVWKFSFSSTGVYEPGTLTLDAKEGTLIETSPGGKR